MPANPRKCCGKNVKFTPRNMVINWDFNQYRFFTNPVIIGNQYVTPAKMANTAPMDRT